MAVSSPGQRRGSGGWPHLTGHLHPEHQFILSRDVRTFTLWRQQELQRETKGPGEGLTFVPVLTSPDQHDQGVGLLGLPTVKAW